jgi:hypothetical protein
MSPHCRRHTPLKEDAISDTAAAAVGLPPVDSINQWEWWSNGYAANNSITGTGATVTPPRTELAIGAAYGSTHGAGNAFIATTVEGLIQGEMKLILTAEGFPIDEAVWTGPQFPNASTNASMWDTAMDCSAGCLFNLTSDITEHHDLAAEQPMLVSAMVARIRAINATVFSPHRGAPSPLGCQVGLDDNGGFWGPFIAPGPAPPSPPPPQPYSKLCGNEMATVCPVLAFRKKFILEDAIGFPRLKRAGV